MKCSRCSRPLKSAAVTSGNLAIGPKCARILGLLVNGPRQHAQKPEQPGQLPLFSQEVSGAKP